ncbi:hypothetical protein ACF0H5_013449 [Mactra antiquata]
MTEEGGDEVAEQPAEKRNNDVSSVHIIVEAIAVVFSILALCIFFPIFLPGSIKIINQYERGLVLRLGKAKRKEVLKPGVVFVLPFIDVLLIQDVRTKCCQTASQQVLTSDSVSVAIDAVLTVDVGDPYQCLLIGQGSGTFVSAAAKRRVQNTLRTACGKLTLTEIINGKEKLAQQIMRTLQKRWSKTIIVRRVEIKDIAIPHDMQRAMASEALSQRQAKAKVISANGEIKASHILKDAAKMVDEAPAAIHLRHFQSLLSISKKNCQTIVMPIPTQLTDYIQQKLSGIKIKIVKEKAGGAVKHN